MKHVPKVTVPASTLLKYRIAGFLAGIFIPMRTPKRGFT
jgi:hypothetical protein